MTLSDCLSISKTNQELLIVLVIAVLIFGPTQIPKLSKIVGKSIKNFRSGMSDGEEEQDTAQQ